MFKPGSWAWRNRAFLIGALLLIALVESIGLLIKHSYLNAQILTVHKDTIDGVATVITTLLLIVGGILSYIRFFKGRTLSKKLNLNLDVNVLPCDEESYLQAVNLEISNVGSVAVWNPNLEIEIRCLGPEGIQVRKVRNWSYPEGFNNDVIDPGETCSNHATEQISKKFFAVTYVATVTSHIGSSWVSALTIPNQVKTNRE